MSVRVLFIMGGVIWGLVTGPDIGLGVAKYVGGLNWPFIAGTREWPQWADWIIIASGVLAGLTVFFAALIIGRNVGDRYEYSPDLRLRMGGAVPWAVIAVGVTVGGISVVTVEDRQQAVVDYVQEQKAALARLEQFAGQIQRFRSVRVTWPGNGETGEVAISFHGKHRGNYLLAWEVWDSANREGPLMEGDIGAILKPGGQNAYLPISPRALVNAWQRRAGSRANKATIAQDFIFRIRLIPEPSRAEWARLPRHEPGNLADGKSILIDEATDSFPVNFEIRGSQIIWYPQ